MFHCQYEFDFFVFRVCDLKQCHDCYKGRIKLPVEDFDKIQSFFFPTLIFSFVLFSLHHYLNCFGLHDVGLGETK